MGFQEKKNYLKKNLKNSYDCKKKLYFLQKYWENTLLFGDQEIIFLIMVVYFIRNLSYPFFICIKKKWNFYV